MHTIQLVFWIFVSPSSNEANELENIHFTPTLCNDNQDDEKVEMQAYIPPSYGLALSTTRQPRVRFSVLSRCVAPVLCCDTNSRAGTLARPERRWMIGSCGLDKFFSRRDSMRTSLFPCLTTLPSNKDDGLDHGDKH
jgi:hypothetical protein